MSRRKRTLIESYKKGYRIINGIIFNPNGEELKGWIKDDGYHFFRPSKKSAVAVHRLVAYQKFGDKMFEPNIEVRHLDNNKQNNLDENIDIGTRSENMMDLPKEERIRLARKNIKYDADEVKDFYNQCGSYVETMKKFDISSKGTLWNIINKR